MPHRVVFAALGVLLAVNLVVLLRTAARASLGPLRRLARGLAAHCGPARDRGAGRWPLSWPWQGAAAADPVAARVAKELDRKRVRRAEKVFRLFPVFMVMGLAITITQRAYRVSAPSSPKSIAQDLIFIGVSIALTIVSSCPTLVTPRVLDSVHTLAMASMVFWTSPAGVDPVGLMFSQSYVLMCLFFLGLSNLRAWHNVFWIMMVTSMTAYTISTCEDHPQCASKRGKIMTTLWTHLVVAAIVVWIEQLLSEAIRCGIHVSSSRNELSAAKALLETICEVVVELDGSHRMKKHSKELADLLMLGPIRSLAGAGLGDFMVLDSDRSDLQRRLDVASENSGTFADVFHVRMRDSNGTGISMELFSVSFRGEDAHLHHLVGMREFTDVPPMLRPLREFHAPAAGAHEMMQQEPKQAILQQPKEEWAQADLTAQHEREQAIRQRPEVRWVVEDDDEEEEEEDELDNIELNLGTRHEAITAGPETRAFRGRHVADCWSAIDSASVVTRRSLPASDFASEAREALEAGPEPPRRGSALQSL